MCASLFGGVRRGRYWNRECLVKVDLVLIRIVFSVLGGAALIAAYGLYFFYDSTIVALGNVFAAVFFFTFCFVSKPFSTQDYKLSHVQRITLGVSIVLMIAGFIHVAM